VLTTVKVLPLTLLDSRAPLLNQHHHPKTFNDNRATRSSSAGFYPHASQIQLSSLPVIMPYIVKEHIALI
jgi:hypothetical protein